MDGDTERSMGNLLEAMSGWAGAGQEMVKALQALRPTMRIRILRQALEAARRDAEVQIGELQAMLTETD